MKITKLWIAIALVIVLGFSACTAKTPDGTQTFTIEELAKYDGKNGNKAYVAIDGKVYDVTNKSEWNGGMHNGYSAGADMSAVISTAPHGKSILSSLTVVGTLK